MIIEEDYVSFKVAKLLKEKGFNWECEYFYDYYEEDDEYVICSIGGSCNREDYPSEYSMPTLQMAMKWLRKVHNIIVITIPSVLQSDNLKWITSIRTFNKEGYYLEDQGVVGKYNTYEAACDNAIKYCLTNLI